MTRAPATELWRLGAAEAARRIVAGELTSVALVEACLERIDAREETVRAWAHLDPAGALRQARDRDAAQAPRGPLHGVPVGVKDIVDTADMPTACGTEIHAGRRPERDAACVARLRAAGAVVLGKTVTTELALYEPSKTRNPADPSRTPGGSSSGSAAAVADGMVPLALGSQTAGSVIRPAAFCGTLGLKPTHGLVDLAGVKPLSAHLDTLGWFAREAADLDLLGAVLADGWSRALPDAGGDADAGPPAFAFARTPWWKRADEDGRRAVESAARRLADAGARVREVDLPEPFAALPDAQSDVQGYDSARNLAWEYERHAERLSAKLRAEIERGRGIPRERAERALELAASCRAQLEREVLADGETLLVPAVAGEPPPLEAHSTGDPWFCRPWTLLGTPALAVPGERGSGGAPIGVQLVAPPGADAALLRAGAWAAARLA